MRKINPILIAMLLGLFALAAFLQAWSGTLTEWFGPEKNQPIRHAVVPPPPAEPIGMPPLDEDRCAEEVELPDLFTVTSDADRLDHCIKRAAEFCEVQTAKLPDARFGLSIKFIVNGKEVLSLTGHAASVFAVDEQAIYFAHYSPSGNGCQVVAYDVVTGQPFWERRLKGIGPRIHSRYRNQVIISISDDFLWIHGQESFGNYTEVLDAKTGRCVGHRVYNR